VDSVFTRATHLFLLFLFPVFLFDFLLDFLVATQPSLALSAASN
jgi:hypothetical protein